MGGLDKRSDTASVGGNQVDNLDLAFERMMRPIRERYDAFRGVVYYGLRSEQPAALMQPCANCMTNFTALERDLRLCFDAAVIDLQPLDVPSQDNGHSEAHK